MNIVLKYSFFSIAATIINIASQRFVFSYSASENIFLIAIITGTIAGFISKYIFDKYFIFNDFSAIPVEETKKLAKYSFFAVFTTLIFWLTEYIFWSIYQTHSAREIGAIIGLSIGYYLKYNLDKKYVFNKAETK
jgi:putative flippase GtrA